MLSRHIVACAGLAALGLAGCAQPPEPQVARAMPLYSKSGAGLCVPSDPIIGATYVPNAPSCEDVCEADLVGASNVAICPPVVDRGRQPTGGNGDDDQLGGRNPQTGQTVP